MNRWLWKAALAVAFSGSAWADDPKKPAEPPKTEAKPDNKKADEDKRTPLEKYVDAKKALTEAEKKFSDAIKVVRDKGEQPSLEDKGIREGFEARNKATNEVQKWALEAAKSDPKSKDGSDALFYVAQSSRPGTKTGDEVLALVMEHHLNDPRVTRVMLGMQYSGLTPAFQKFSETVEAKCTNKETVLASKVVRGKIMLKSRDKAVAKDGEKLLDTVMTESKDAKISGIAVAKLVEGELFEYRNLQVGMPVPEVEGVDVDGVKFKLSEYKGKVVMLDFWGHW